MTVQRGFCPQCGTARQGDLRFCASCGFDYWKAAEAAANTQTAPAAAPSTQADPAAAEQDRKSRRVGCITLAVIAVIVVAVISALNQDDDPEVAGASQSAEASPEPTLASEEPSTAPSLAPASVAESAAPTVVPSPVVSIAPEPAFANITLNGTGNAVPRFDIPEDSAAIAEITHSGASNFAVWAVDGSGSPTDLLVNTIGNYSGTVLFDESAGSHTDAFEIEADGPWTIIIKPVTEAFRWDGSDVLTGSGDDVAILDPPSDGLKSTTVTHSGSGNFAIWSYSASGTDLLVNEIGNFSGEVLLSDGTFLFEVTATGQWTMNPPE